MQLQSSIQNPKSPVSSIRWLFGSIFSMKILGKFSRKRCLQLANYLVIGAGILTLIGNWKILLISRIAQGFCVGFFSVLVPIMVKEVSPTQLTGPLGAFISPSIGFGFIMAYLLPYSLQNFLQIPPQNYWRFTFNFTLITSSLQLYLLKKYFCFETPKYYIIKGRIQELRELLKLIYKPEYCHTVQQQKMKDIQQFHIETIHHEPTQSKLTTENINNEDVIVQDQQNIIEGKQKKLPETSPLAIFYAIILPFFQQLSGINVFVTFGSEVVSKKLPNLIAEMPLIINSEKLVFAVLAVFLLNKFKRKDLLLVGSFLVSVSLFLVYLGLEGDSQNEGLIIFAFFLFISSFVSSMGPITWLHMSEIVQPNIIPCTVMVHWLMACLIVTLFPIIRSHSDNPGCPKLFLFFGICTLIFVLLSKLIMIQTKNKQQYEIRKQYSLKWKKISKLLH